MPLPGVKPRGTGAAATPVPPPVSTTGPAASPPPSGEPAAAPTGIKVTQNGIFRPDRTPFADGMVSIDQLDRVKLLGSGSNGEVYLYRHKDSRKRYAVKFVRVNPAEKADVKKKILSEVSMSILAQSAYAVKLENAFLRDTNLIIVLEYMDGGTLEQFLATNKKVSEPAAAYVAARLLHGLADIHRRQTTVAAPSSPGGGVSTQGSSVLDGYSAAPSDANLNVSVTSDSGAAAPTGGSSSRVVGRQALVHRDLKPANVMLNKRGELKLADFGGANTADTIGLATVVGTYTFMAPERIAGKMYSTPSDIWSFGVILAQMLLGRFPFKATQYFELLREIDSFTAISLDGATLEAQDFVGKCLVRDPSQRSTAAELLKHPWILRHNTSPPPGCDPSQPCGPGYEEFLRLLSPPTEPVSQATAQRQASTASIPETAVAAAGTASHPPLEIQLPGDPPAASRQDSSVSVTWGGSTSTPGRQSTESSPQTPPSSPSGL